MDPFVRNHLLKLDTAFCIRCVIFGLLVFLCVAIFFLCSVPPVSKDALVHHLAVPKLYLKHGGFHEIPSMVFSYYPMNLDLLYLIPLYFGNDIAPKFIHFSFALLTAWLIFYYLRRRIDLTYALGGALFFLSVPIIVKLSITVYVDLGLVFFSFASLLLILRWMETDFQRRNLILSAVSCGLALGTKYNGLVTLCLLVLFVPFLYARYAKGGKPGFFAPLAQALVYISIALLVFSPWMARNYHWKKNPIYPLFDGRFSSLRGDEQAASQARGEALEFRRGLFTKRKLYYKEKWWETALLPIRIFFEGKDRDPQYFDGKLNPFLLILPIFAFLGNKRDPPIMRSEKLVLLNFVVLYFGIVFFFGSIARIRYIAPIIPPLTILSAYGVRNLVGKLRGLSNRLRYTLGLLALFLGFSYFMAISVGYLLSEFRYVGPFGYLTGQVSRDDYVDKYVLEYPALRYINEDLPPHSTTLFLFLGDRGYYCDRAYVLDRGDLSRSVKESSSAEQMLAKLRNRGITHMLIRYDIFDRWKEDRRIFNQSELRILNEFMTKYLKLLFFRWGYGVSELRHVSSAS